MSVNADQNELDKFNQIASRWWDPEGESKPLHRMNPLRTHYINSRSPVKNKAVLDVGCGGGLLAEALASLGAQVTAIDLADEALEVAKLHLFESGHQIDYQNISVEAMADSQAPKFDIITCLEMLEHVPEPKRIIESCAKLLKPGGSIYFSTLNRTAKAYLMAIVGAEKVLKILPQGIHDYNKFIRPSELDLWASSHGLILNHASGIHFNPITEQFWLAPNLDVNYICWYQKP